MRSKLTFTVLAAAALFGATAFALAASAAQPKPAAGASAPSNAMAMDSMEHHSMYHRHHQHHLMHTGLSRRQMDVSRPGGRPVSRKAAD